MISENGHLTFSAGYNKDIRFTTSGTGSVKVGAEDLIQQINQVSSWWVWLKHQILSKNRLILDQLIITILKAYVVSRMWCYSDVRKWEFDFKKKSKMSVGFLVLLILFSTYFIWVLWLCYFGFIYFLFCFIVFCLFLLCFIVFLCDFCLGLILCFCFVLFYFDLY